MSVLLGKIVKSNGHTDYVCQVYAKHETERPPAPIDYGFGTFVKIELDDASTSYLVGLIYDTVLLNPDFGRLGPRLSTTAELGLFSPDYLDERAVLIGITTIGIVQAGQVQQGIPMLAATSDSLVHSMSVEEVRGFHMVDGNVGLRYIPLLVQRPDPLTRQLALTVTQTLTSVLPDATSLLGVMADDLRWQLQINAMGS